MTVKIARLQQCLPGLVRVHKGNAIKVIPMVNQRSECQRCKPGFLNVWFA